MTTPASVNPFADRQTEPRKESVGGSVTSQEKQDILTALSRGGFDSASEGVRDVLLAYTESAAVRDLVHNHLRERKAS